MDSKINHDALPTCQNHDQLSVAVTADSTASLDLQNPNNRIIPKSVGSSPLPTESVHAIEAVSLKLLQMFRSSMDSKLKDYRLPKSKNVSLKHDKQLSVPVTTKKTALRDLQNDNERVVPKSGGSSSLLTETGSSVETVKLSGTKRPAPESLLSSRHHSPGGSAANGHLVYVRRKPDTEPGKCSNDDSTSIGSDHSQSKANSHLNEHIKEPLPKNESVVLPPEALNIDRPYTECMSRAPAGPLPVAKSSNTCPSAVSNHLQVRSSQPSLDRQKRTKVQHWEERYYQLQNFLKQLDNSSHEAYVQMLRSVSSVELSRHAVELEKRSIQLSLTEGREWQRVMLLDVLGKDPKNHKAMSTQQEQ